MKTKGIRYAGVGLVSVLALNLNAGCDFLGVGGTDTDAEDDASAEEESGGDPAEESGAEEEDDGAEESTGGGDEESSGGEPASTSAAETFGGSTSFGTTGLGSTTTWGDEGTSTSTTGFGSTSSSTSWVSSSEDGGVMTTGEDTSTTGVADDTTAEPPVLIDYASEIQPIWDASCASSSCHGGLFTPNLSPSTSLAALVDQASSVGVPYVTPGVPEESYVYLKLIDDPSISGAAMPFGQPMLDEASLELVRTWIEQLAP